MKLKPIGSNMTEIETKTARILFSYSTPVAAWVELLGYLKTDCRWSMTTSRHISKWLDGAEAETRPQEYFDNLLDF